MTGGTLPNPAGKPNPKPPPLNSPAIRSAAQEALVQLIDGQIATRRAEIDELTRIRRAVLGGSQMSRG